MLLITSTSLIGIWTTCHRYSACKLYLLWKIFCFLHEYPSATSSFCQSNKLYWNCRAQSEETSCAPYCQCSNYADGTGAWRERVSKTVHVWHVLLPQRARRQRVNSNCGGSRSNWEKWSVCWGLCELLLASWTDLASARDFMKFATSVPNVTVSFCQGQRSEFRVICLQNDPPATWMTRPRHLVTFMFRNTLTYLLVDIGSLTSGHWPEAGNVSLSCSHYHSGIFRCSVESVRSAAIFLLSVIVCIVMTIIYRVCTSPNYIQGSTTPES